MAEVTAHQARQTLGQADGGRRRGLEEGVVIGQLDHLVIGDLGQFFAPIADHDAPQTGHAVEEARAVTVIDGAALGAGDDGRAAQSLHQALVLLGRQVVGDVQTAKFLDVVIARLHERSSFCKILFWFWLRPSPRRARPRRR